MKNLKSFMVVTFTAMSLFAMTTQATAGDKGTLYGNAGGTSFCCKSGTNDCSASACKEAFQ